MWIHFSDRLENAFINLVNKIIEYIDFRMRIGT